MLKHNASWIVVCFAVLTVLVCGGGSGGNNIDSVVTLFPVTDESRYVSHWSSAVEPEILIILYCFGRKQPG
jgi:hypothetical protein